MFHFFLKISQNVPFFSQNLHVAKERANTKVKGGMPKKMKFSQNFSKCSIFFSKCHFFLKMFHLFPKCSPLFSQILPIVFSNSSIVFSNSSIFFSNSSFFSQNVPVVSQNIFIPNKHQKKFKISWANPEGRGLLRAAENWVFFLPNPK